MKKISIYKYKRPDGGTTVSPIRPEHGEYEEMYRLVADEGKILRKGKYGIELNSIEVDNDEEWEEYDDLVLDGQQKSKEEETQLIEKMIAQSGREVTGENIDDSIEELLRENNKLKYELKNWQEKTKNIEQEIGKLSTYIKRNGINQKEAQ